MVRLFTFLGGMTYLVLAFLWAIARPAGTFLVNWARTTNVPGQDQTFFQVWAEALGKSALAYFDFMQNAGPTVYVCTGLVLIAVTFVWWKVEPLWISSFGIKLKAVFPNDVNLKWKHPEPFAKETSFYFRNGGTGHWISQVEYFVGIRNTTNKTIDNVQARVIMAGILPGNMNLPLLSDDGKLEVSISPKSLQLFRVGKVYTERKLMAGIQHISEVQYASYKNQITNGLMIHHKDVASGKEALLPLLNNNGTSVQIEITGRDVLPLYAEFSAIKNKEPAFFFVRQSRKDSNASDIIKRSRKFKFHPSLRERLRIYGINIKQWATGKKEYVSW